MTKEGKDEKRIDSLCQQQRRGRCDGQQSGCDRIGTSDTLADLGGSKDGVDSGDHEKEKVGMVRAC